MPWEKREKSISAISSETGKSIGSKTDLKNMSNFRSVRLHQQEIGKSNDYKFTQVFPSQANNQWTRTKKKIFF